MASRLWCCPFRAWCAGLLAAPPAGRQPRALAFGLLLPLNLRPLPVRHAPQADEIGYAQRLRSGALAAFVNDEPLVQARPARFPLPGRRSRRLLLLL